MKDERQEHTGGGLRTKVARKVIQGYRLRRGKDRLYLMLRSLLRIPRFVFSEISPDVVLNLDLDDYLQRWMFCHRLRDEVDYYWISQFLRAGDRFLDIGANIGIVSLLAAAAVGRSGRVFAVEALPTTRRALEQNIKLNGRENITVLPFAVLNECKEVPFFASLNGNIGGSSMSGSGSKDEPVIVAGRTIDSLFSEGLIDGCDVLKMDIEGAELLALEGMKTMFEKNRPRAVMIEVAAELLARFDSEPGEVLSFFRSRGYHWYTATGSGFVRFSDGDLLPYNNLWAIRKEHLDARFLA